VSPFLKLSAVKLALQLKRRTCLHLSEMAKRGRPECQRIETPQINFHDYVSSKSNSMYIQDKLRLCDSILPGVSDAFNALPKCEAELSSLKQVLLTLDNMKHDNEIFQF
jgi:hypothetical protein